MEFAGDNKRIRCICVPIWKLQSRLWLMIPHINLHLSAITHCQTLLSNTVCELKVRCPRLKILSDHFTDVRQKTFNMPGGPSSSPFFPQRASNESAADTDTAQVNITSVLIYSALQMIGNVLHCAFLYC